MASKSLQDLKQQVEETAQEAVPQGKPTILPQQGWTRSLQAAATCQPTQQADPPGKPRSPQAETLVQSRQSDLGSFSSFLHLVS
ncbi:adipogenesis regulatory factor isoform X1 [Microcebus murinus]|uniref:adipogenesis regulatory factor isoform X1 n=1 Tax=Microcebus murinus TaxID=30608 RepID=UPI003F6BBA42